MESEQHRSSVPLMLDAKRDNGQFRSIMLRPSLLHLQIGCEDGLFSERFIRFGNSPSIRAAYNNFNEGYATDDSQHDGENSYPHSCSGGTSGRLISGVFFFLFGSALMKLTFYVGDEPVPPRLTKLLCLGIGILSVPFIVQGVTLIIWFIVTQKHLAKPHFCNTVIAIRRTQMANVLSTDKQIAVISALAEGSSIRSIERMTGVHRDTIMRLGMRVGQSCARVLDVEMRDIPCQQLQFDEIWGFIGK